MADPFYAERRRKYDSRVQEMHVGDFEAVPNSGAVASFRRQAKNHKVQTCAVRQSDLSYRVYVLTTPLFTATDEEKHNCPTCRLLSGIPESFRAETGRTAVLTPKGACDLATAATGAALVGIIED